MGSQSIRRGRAKPRARLSSQPLSGSDDLDHKLSEILTSIAHLLLRNGYGFARLGKLTKLAFVNAAKALNDDSKSKISIARIAAVTGLTRIEVSQLLRSEARKGYPASEPLNRAERVAIGWQGDNDYCDSRGLPLALPFASAGRSFSRLVKKYSGDIPARAMLIEMKRLRMVQHDSSDTVRLARGRRIGSRSTLSAIRAITPWVNFLAEVAVFGQSGELTSTARKLRLQFDSLPQSLAASREIENRRATFIESLRQLGGRSNESPKYQLDVSIGVAVAAAKPVASSKNRVRKR
jgi:hypothetical protein